MKWFWRRRTGIEPARRLVTPSPILKTGAGTSATNASDVEASGAGAAVASQPMAIQQCPKCELRFANDSELDDHLMRDHDDPESSEFEVPEPRQ